MAGINGQFDPQNATMRPKPFWTETHNATKTTTTTYQQF